MPRKVAQKPDPAPTASPESGASVPPAIGWREYIQLPDWCGERLILAKSDTGALGCAIDVDNIQELPGNRVRFDLIHQRRRDGALAHEQVETTVRRRARVRSSNGVLQTRLSVETRLKVGSVEKLVEFSLVSREDMLCRVLLGRRALEADFLVDSGRKFLLSSPPAPAQRKRARKKPGKP